MYTSDSDYRVVLTSLFGPTSNCSGVKLPVASLLFLSHTLFVKGKVIRVIVTSTMIKLGQCNPNPPPLQARLKQRGGKEDEEAITRLRVDLNMETLERALLARWVGNCVVLGLNSPHNCSDMFLPLPVVCDLWCISMICLSVFYLCPVLLLSDSVLHFQVYPMVFHCPKEYLF